MPVWWQTWGMTVHTALRVIENLTWEMFAKQSMKVPKGNVWAHRASKPRAPTRAGTTVWGATLSPQSLACYSLMHYSGTKYAQISPLKPNLLAMLKEFYGCWWPHQGHLNCECMCQEEWLWVEMDQFPLFFNHRHILVHVLDTLATSLFSIKQYLEHHEPCYLALCMFVNELHVYSQKVEC